MSSPSNGVVIVGAGPGGLTLANILHATGVPFTLYDLDDSAHGRAQGGSLDMHAESGTRALEEAGLLDEFNKVARPEDDHLRICGKDGKVLMKFPGPQDGEKAFGALRPEIDRGQLRALLLSKLPQVAIKWGHRLTHISFAGSSDDTYFLEFDAPTGPSKVSSNLVVGADGAWSRVRALVSSATPEYTGVIFVEGRIDNVDALGREDIASLVGRGTFFSLDDHKGISAQRNSGGRVIVYALLTVPEPWPETCGLPFSAQTAPEARQTVHAGLLRFFDGWSPTLRGLVRIPDAFTPRRMYMLPVGLRWPHRRGVTLVGDAAHLMSSFAGEGANVAMLDGLELGNAIAAAFAPQSGGEDRKARLSAAVAGYEEAMFVRAKDATWKSNNNMERFLLVDGAGADKAVEAMKVMFLQGQAGGPPPS